MDIETTITPEQMTLTLSPAAAAVLLARAYQGFRQALDDQGADTFMGGITKCQLASIAAQIKKLRAAHPELY